MVAPEGETRVSEAALVFQKAQFPRRLETLVIACLSARIPRFRERRPGAALESDWVGPYFCGSGCEGEEFRCRMDGILAERRS